MTLTYKRVRRWQQKNLHLSIPSNVKVDLETKSLSFYENDIRQRLGQKPITKKIITNMWGG